MIACVSDIMKREIQTIDFYDGLRKAERLMEENNIGCLPVLKEGMLAGILTLKEISKAHPNRIAADAMNKKIISVPAKTSLWQAKHIMEENSIERLLVLDANKLVGLVTQADLLFELGKCFDLLTGLYQSDYIFFHGMELLSNDCEISIIFLDLNKFGSVDKEYGHAHGDIILRELGLLLEKNSPPDTYLCRYGGDEFVVLTPYKPDKCMLLAENLIKIIANHVFSNKLFITASAGIAGGRRQKERNDTSLDIMSDLINLASLASTKAKNEKKNLILADAYCNREFIA